MKFILWMCVCLMLVVYARPAWAAEYYVSSSGDNAHSGLSREHAWRTVNYAAARVRAGDTVFVAGGVYNETVRVRATGEKHKPITFKAIPGEKVVFDGQARSLGCAFNIAYKSHLRFDGFYFVEFNGLGNYELPWSNRTPGNGNSGVFALYQSHDVQITRCFSDGTGVGYAPSLVIARNCKDLLIRNCVITSAMGGGLHILYSSNMRIENNVFLVPMIYATVLQNNTGESAVLKNNIFTDNIITKHHVRLLYNSDPVDAGTQNNCFFVRTSDDERAWNEQLTLKAWIAQLAATYHQSAGQEQIIANPGFRATQGQQPLGRNGQPLFLGDFLLGKQDLDFPDLFVTNPQVIRRGIGLEPKAFSDFHFHHTSP